MWDEFDEPVSIRKNSPRQKWAQPKPGEMDWKNRDFQCVHCKNHVTSEAIIAGVRNRNHCPYCLWSRHLDLFKAGDRLAACKAGMQPMALTLKSTHKKYGRSDQGELMVVHFCTDCGKVSINRIAADDDADRIREIFNQSLGMCSGETERLQAEGIRVLTRQDRALLDARLNGWSEPEEDLIMA